MGLIEKINCYSKNCPNKIAHINGNSKITYEKLIRMSDALSCYIIQKFGKDKTPIVVYGHKKHEMIISFLACVKAGHAYIPVDSSFPIKRVNDIINASETKLIINVDDNQDIDLGENIINMEHLKEIFEKYDGNVPDKKYEVKGEDVYYIIFTSGSTGKPKGVQITLSCLESFVKWGTGLCNNINENTVIMNQAPFSFDLSVMDLYISLANGCTLFSIEKHMISNMKELFEKFSISDIAIWVSTPSFIWMCLADSKFDSSLLPKLKLLLFCGETLSNSCVERIKNRFPEAKVINTYGPTEATVAVTSVEVDEEVNKIAPLPVGSIKSDCKLLIVDENMNEVEEGQKGEIVIAGDSVSIGYYKNPEITKKVFFEYDINGVKKRAYRTGDSGYIKDGQLYYNGRIDFQIKLNGYRIEIEDVENNLKKIDIVKNAVVIPISKENKVQYIMGIVILNVTTDKKSFEISTIIKNKLKEFLPDYMVPRKIIVRESLPMTINGKVDRKLLMGDYK